MIPSKEPILEAYKLAIKALEQQPTTTTNNNEPITVIYPTIVCDDAISRAEAQTEIMMSKSITAFDRDLWIKTKDAVQILRELPSVTPSVMSKEDFIYALKSCEYTVHNGQVMYEENELIKRFEKLPSVTPSRHVNCEIAEHDGNGCLGYNHYGDDFPIKECLHCPKYTSYEEE
jgi:hypothetical protein